MFTSCFTLNCARFQVVGAVKIKGEVSCFVTPCSDVVGHHNATGRHNLEDPDLKQSTYMHYSETVLHHGLSFHILS